MYRFNNDYNCGAHPEVLKALTEHNFDANPGYGLDPWSDKAREAVKAVINRPDADVHFLVGGTQANATVIDAALRPYESVLCAETGHIFCHETGAVEHLGHKIEPFYSGDGKIYAEQIEAAALSYENSGVPEHVTTPRLVYISFTTELGTIYSKKELQDMYKVCKDHGLFLFIDGARMGYGLAAEGCDVSPEDIANNCDVFYFGGTKCGALFGEAVVILNDELKPHFRSVTKQNGALLAKGFLNGIQFYTLFKDGLYFSICKKAADQAIRIKDAFEKKGIPFYVKSPSNQQFVVLTKAQQEVLAKDFVYEEEKYIDADHNCVRFCTSWSTEDEAVDALVKAIEAL